MEYNVSCVISHFQTGDNQRLLASRHLNPVSAKIPLSDVSFKTKTFRALQNFIPLKIYQAYRFEWKLNIWDNSFKASKTRRLVPVRGTIPKHLLAYIQSREFLSTLMRKVDLWVPLAEALRRHSTCIKSTKKQSFTFTTL